MFEIIKPGTQFDFVGWRRFWLWVSVGAVALTLVLLFTKGLNYGIDFTGGAEVQIKVPQSWEIGKVRSELSSGGVKDPRVQQIGDRSLGEYLIRVQGDESSLNRVSEQVTGALSKSLKPGEYEIQRVDVVGPAAGSSLRISGLLSLLYAVLCILIYVTIRFDIRYSPGVVVALFHDTMIILGVFIITQKPFDLQILAAILALIGYSNNDTIVVYDRVRETLHTRPGLKIEQAVNQALNETLGRTFLTSFCTFITVFALWLLGGKVIQDFAFTLMVGLLIGTYSSIFIASSLVIFMSQFYERKAANDAKRPKKEIKVRPEPKFQG